ncbi:MAG: hypothetical protein Q9M28_01115 [Mariprofundaceae bacterium]|nr:hypothetical protein [Mariprofundaceae bacterium]
MPCLYGAGIVMVVAVCSAIGEEKTKHLIFNFEVLGLALDKKSW